MLSVYRPPHSKSRNNLAYIPPLEAPVFAPIAILSNQHLNAVRVKEEAIELALHDIPADFYAPSQAQEQPYLAAPPTQLVTSASANSTLPMVKQEADLEDSRTHQRWIDCKKWLSEHWKTVPAVPSTRSRCDWAKARGFVPSTVHKWFASKKHSYKQKNHGRIHPQDGYELSIEEPRESLLVSLAPTPGPQPSELSHTPAFDPSSSPLPQTPGDLEPLGDSLYTLESSFPNVNSKPAKCKTQIPFNPPLFFPLAPGTHSGQIAVAAQASSADAGVFLPPPPPAKRGRKRKIDPAVGQNIQVAVESEHVSKRRKTKVTTVTGNVPKTLDFIQPSGTSVETHGTFDEKRTYQTYLPVAQTYQFKTGQGEPGATWEDHGMATIKRPRPAKSSKIITTGVSVDPAIPLELHQNLKSYPPPSFFLEQAKGVKRVSQTPTSLNFPPHSLASMLYTSYLIAPFPADGTPVDDLTLPIGHSMDWFASPQASPSCLETESRQPFAPSSTFDILKVSVADVVDWASTVRASHALNSELGLWNPEVEGLPPWKCESHMEFDLEAEWP